MKRNLSLFVALALLAIATPLFAHHSEIQMNGYRQLDEGQRVQFEVGEGKKGPKDTAVRPV